MRKLCFFLIALSGAIHAMSQDDIQLDLDSIKNIKTTRYSSVNEVGIAISVGGKQIDKILGNTRKINLSADKPSVMFRTVHGVLVNPKFFIGGGAGIDFLPNSNAGGRFYYLTFPFFAEMREYLLSGSFNIFLSERVGGAVFVDTYLSKYGIGNKGTASGAFGEFMIGGRYVPSGKKLAIHFGVGYRLQHLQRKIDVYSSINGLPTQTYANTPEITIKHYVPVTIGITF